jgi:hypothetical protein
VLFMSRGSSLDTTMVLGVIVDNVYRKKGQPMRARIHNNRVTMDRKQVPLNIV